MPKLTWFDPDRLRAEIRAMSPRSLLYRILRDELKALGRWRVQPRGDPAKGYAESRKGAK